MALLLGYGAAAINPYLAFDTITELVGDGTLRALTPRQATRNYIKACGKGVLKIMSKMGISTVASYTGAQVFEAIGLSDDVVERYFTGTVSRIGGIGLDEIAREVLTRHGRAWPARPSRAGPPRPRRGRRVPVAAGGRVPPVQPDDGPQAAALHPDPAATTSSSSTPGAVDDQAARLGTLRGLFRVQPAGEIGREPVPIEEVESVVGDRQAFQHRRDVVRLDFGRGPRDSRHRHEPASAVAPTPGRAARTPIDSSRTPTAICAAAPSSRWRPAASA